MVELEETVKQLKNDKALGSDGLKTNFFHAYWHTIKDEVMDIA